MMKHRFSVTTSAGDKDRAINEIQYAFDIKNVACSFTEHQNHDFNYFLLTFDVEGDQNTIMEVLENIRHWIK